MSDRRSSDRRDPEADRRLEDRRRGDHGVPDGVEAERRAADRRELDDRRAADRRQRDDGPPKPKPKPKSDDQDDDDQPVTKRELRELTERLAARADRRKTDSDDGNRQRRSTDHPGTGPADPAGGPAGGEPRRRGFLWRN